MKAIVIGCPGAGKSTFSIKLGKICSTPVYHLDNIWHKPDRTNISREDFDNQLRDILSTPSWIIDGNYSRTLQMRIDSCDIVYFLDYSTDVCIDGVLARIGKPRPDMPWIENEFYPEFRKWIEDFPKRDLPEIEHCLDNCSESIKIFRFKNRTQGDDYLDSLI